MNLTKINKNSELNRTFIGINFKKYSMNKNPI